MKKSINKKAAIFFMSCVLISDFTAGNCDDEEIDLALQMADDAMDAADAELSRDLSGIRTGKASPDMLKNVTVEYYGTPMPISQIGNITVSDDGQALVVTPWEKSLAGSLEKAITQSNSGLNPQSDGQTIRIPVPPLTEERRKDLAKKAKNEAEEARVQIRTARKEAMYEIKKQLKNGDITEDAAKQAEEKLQKKVEEQLKKVDKKSVEKEKAIMEI